MASAWGVAWGQAWGNAWGFLGAPTIYYQEQGGGLPTISRRQREREQALSESLEQTMRTMLWHPKAVAAVAASVTAAREAVGIRQREATTAALIQVRERLADEQDEEDSVLMQ